MLKIFIAQILFFIFLNVAHAESRILFLGDSLTEGYGVAKEQAYPSVIANLFEKSGKKEIKIINAGESGSKTSSAYPRLRWHLRSKPNLLVLALGANDGLRGVSVEVIRENLQKTIDLAKNNNIRVVLAGMQMPINYGEKYRREFAKLFKDLAVKNNLVLIPFLLEGVAREKELNLDDGIHPNDKGHQKIAETVYYFIKDLI